MLAPRNHSAARVPARMLSATYIDMAADLTASTHAVSM